MRLMPQTAAITTGSHTAVIGSQQVNRDEMREHNSISLHSTGYNVYISR